MRQVTNYMNRRKISWLIVALAALLLGGFGCDRAAISGSKLTAANYDKITTGMSKSQVETILGKPTTTDTTDFVLLKKTTYRFEDGKNFAIVTFKNDEGSEKDSNLTR